MAGVGSRDCSTCKHALALVTSEPCRRSCQFKADGMTAYEPEGKQAVVKMPTEKGVKYDNGKPQLSLVCAEFVRILYRNHRNRAVVEALLTVKALSNPTVCTEAKFIHALFIAIDALAEIGGRRQLLEQCAVAMGPMGGCKKYSRNNWRLGMDAQRLLDAAERHLVAILDGEKVDAETTAMHHGNAAFCLQCIAEYLSEPGKPHMQALFDTAKKENWSCKPKQKS